MSEPVTDPAEYCKMTETWLSERDLRVCDGQIDPEAVYDGQIDPDVVDDECGSDEQAVPLDEPADLDKNHDPAASAPAADKPQPAGGRDNPDLGRDSSDSDIDQAPAVAPSAAGDTTAAPTITHGSQQPSAIEAPPRFNKRIAAGFAGATVAATVIAAGALLAMRSQPHTTDPDHLAPPPARPPAAAAAPTTATTAQPAEATDPPIPYTATAVGCLPGSTAAQSAAGTDPTQAWVCVTGGNIGQYVRLDLGRPMVITAACVTPGWVGHDASGADQWHQHSVLTRVQWTFNDSPPTVVPKDTNSVHGDACQPMPGHGVLASAVLMLVQGVGRAPADAAPTTSTPAGDDNPLAPILGSPAAPAPAPPTDPDPGADESHTDPADNSFATSSIKLFGHPPQ